MTVAAVVAAQTIYQGASPNEYLFPGLCKKQNGDFLMMARRASGHTVADGTLVMRTSATGLTGSWSSETVVFTPSGVMPNVAAGLPRLLDDGRVVVMCWYNNSGTTPYTVTTLVSTDETCTSWVRGGNVAGVSADGATCESPVVVAPDGTWLLAVSGTEVAGSHPWSSWIVESDDEGATWTFKAWVARTASPSGSYPGGEDHEEPWLLHVSGDTYLCAVRTGETGWTSSTGMYTHIWRSTDGCVTWTDLGRLNSTHKHFSRMAMCRNPLTGTITLHHRLYGTGGSGHTTGVGQGAYYWTNDDADTWSTGKLLDGDGAIPSNPSQPPGHSYGDIVAHDGGFAAIWADEVPPSGSSSAIRFAAYSDDAPLIAQAVGRSLAVPYTVREGVGRSLALPYGVTGPAGRSLALTYVVNAPVGRSVAFPYGVETTAYRTMRLLIPAAASYSTRRTLLDTLTPAGPFTARGTSRRRHTADGSSRAHADLTGGPTP